MKILLHPTYFPSIAQMVAVVKAEAVIFEKEDNYQKQTYRSRAYVAHSNGKLLLNVPVKHSHDGHRQKFRNVKVENDFRWQDQHWKSLQVAYRTSPFFEFYEDDLAPLFQKEVQGLWNHNIKIFDLLCDLIGIECEYKFTSDYQLDPDETDMRHLAVAKKEKDYSFETYTQVLGANHEFLKNLSVLDLLFNEGPNTINYLEGQSISFDS